MAVSIYFIYGLITVFDTKYEKVKISQHIGGTLICNSSYMSDLHSWQYDISYIYQKNDRLFYIGNGTYYGREWKKDEQLIQFKDWTVLKTGGSYGTDKIIIGNTSQNKWVEYEFTAKNIENKDLWKATKSRSLLNYCCVEIFIEKIEYPDIMIKYRYRTNENLPNKYEVKNIHYKIDPKTGEPIMMKVE